MKIVGLMSGTSADGLDIALCEVQETAEGMQAKVITGTTIPYDAAMRQRILTACDPDRSSTPHISALHTDLGIFIGEQVRAFLQGNQASADLIASHGQTIWHEVQADGAVQSTLQIGSAAHIAEITRITTIHDFRTRDVAAGGQGAPLTSFVDGLLLRHPTKTRAIQNIGGIGNVSILNAGDDSILAFDTGPGNVLMDSAVSLLTDGAQVYDHDGQLAKCGTIDEAWLNELMQHPYYQRKPPKTTGRELFSPALAANYVQQGRERGLSDTDIIATLTALTARSIAHAYETYAPGVIHEVIVGGGGARNPALMHMLAEFLPDCTVQTHDAIGLNSDYKEALVFAVLGWLTWHNRVGTSPQQTGARHASVLGSITPGENYLQFLQALMTEMGKC